MQIQQMFLCIISNTTLTGNIEQVNALNTRVVQKILLVTSYFGNYHNDRIFDSKIYKAMLCLNIFAISRCV